MENIYLIMLIILVLLAILDLVVGVSNDAVNFLNSAVGSRAFPTRTILIVASIGVFVGAAFSSGMMEVARKGIFNPEGFYFDEIMILFVAVMIADVLLLDFFNTMGLPTSTTVSIVFDLLGAACAVAFWKLYNTTGNYSEILTYINTDKTIIIISAIFLSVILAFTLGVIIQYLSRLIFSFQYEKNLKYFGGIFGGLAITAISFFIILKGMHHMSFISEGVKQFISENTYLIIGVSIVFWSLISQILQSVLKVNILKVTILLGTFALALSFAGNDLVNFIGVPIAAWQSFTFWQDSGVAASDFSMSILSGEVDTPTILLLLAGGIMVAALWFSSKARHVMDTELSLARQDEGKERFEPNALSRFVVRYTIGISNIVKWFVPKSVSEKIYSKFRKPSSILKDKRIDEPMFDLVRASVNLVVASILISIGTNYQLPLSTTYVTFMVAMGTSLADRAWDRESAVYRVAGVFNVIGGWFLTAIGAFLGAALMATIIWFGGVWAVIILAGLVAFVMVYSLISHRKRMEGEKDMKSFSKHDILTIRQITLSTSENISDVLNYINKRYNRVIKHLNNQDLRKLKRDTKKLHKLEDKADLLKDNIFYIIKSVEENSVRAGEFYLLISDHLAEMIRSIAYITRLSFRHINNQHKKLKSWQIKNLTDIDGEMGKLFNDIILSLDRHDFENIDEIINEKQILAERISKLIQDEINHIRTSETSPKNTKLYFGLLLESKDLVASTLEILKLFKAYYKQAKEKF